MRFSANLSVIFLSISMSSGFNMFLASPNKDTQRFEFNFYFHCYIYTQVNCTRQFAPEK